MPKGRAFLHRSTNFVCTLELLYIYFKGPKFLYMPFLRTLFILFFLLPFFLQAQNQPVTKQTEEVWNYATESWEFNKEWQYSFNANAQIQTEAYFTWNHEDISWNNKLEKQYYYDDDNRLILISKKIWRYLTESWSSTLFIGRREYDDNGCLVKSIGEYSDLGVAYSSPAEIKQYKVKTDCEVIEILHQYQTGNGPFYLDSIFSYGLVDSVVRYRIQNEQLELESIGNQYERRNLAGQPLEAKELLYYYDDRGYKDKTGIWRNYKYNEKGDLVYYDYFEGRIGGLCRKEYVIEYDLFYDDQNRLIRKDQYEVLMENDRQIFYRTLYEYYPCGDLVREATKYGMITGEPIPRQRTTYSYLNPIDCNEVAVEVIVIPNPAKHGDVIEITSELLFAEDAKLYIFDTAGKLLRQKAIPEYTAQVNMKTGWDWQGFYFVFIESSLGKATAKLVVF